MMVSVDGAGPANVTEADSLNARYNLDNAVEHGTITLLKDGGVKGSDAGSVTDYIWSADDGWKENPGG
jgi:hypothetical protein